MTINQPGPHLDHMLRQTRLHHAQLSAMADVKANMLLTIASVAITLSAPHVLKPHLTWPIIVLMAFSLITIGLAAYAAMPKLPQADNQSRPDWKSPTFNLLFFGDFVRLRQEEFTAAMEETMNDASRVYDAQVREIYTLGVFLAKKKYRFLRLAYLALLTGLAVSFILLLVLVAAMP